MSDSEYGLFQGRVEYSDASTRLLRIKLLEGPNTTHEGMWVAGMISTMLGIRVNYMPPVGSTVLCLYTGKSPLLVLGSPSPIFGGSPADNRRSVGGPDVTQYTGGQADGSSKKYRGGLPPLDLLEGEVDMTNLLDVGASFLTGLARLKAGEEALVEVSLLDSLVRIVSRNYEHSSPFGSFRVVTDGNRPSIILEGTSYRHESVGSETEGSVETPLQENQAKEFPQDQYSEEIRARLQLFAGWLGDFVSMWVTDPLSRLESAAKDATGKFRAQIGQDGTCLVQSLAEISLEKVVRIPVPVRLRKEEDPEGNRSNEDMTQNDWSRAWQDIGDSDIYAAAYQLRSYARWLSNGYMLSRFRKLDKDWRISEQTEQEEPAVSDPDKATGPAQYYEAYACIRILRNGDIVLVNGHNTSFTMSGENVHVSASGHGRFEFGGDVEFLGRNINMAASRNINLTAAEGGIIVASKKWIKNICTLGGILIRSDAPPLDAEEAVADRNDFPDHDYAIRKLVGNEEDADDILNHSIDGVTVQSSGKVSVYSRAATYLRSRGAMWIQSPRLRFLTREVSFIDVAGKVFAQLISGLGFKVQGAGFFKTFVESDRVQQRQELKAGGGISSHSNHVFRTPEYTPEEWDLRYDMASFEDIATAANAKQISDSVELPSKFGNPTANTLPVSTTQMELELDDDYGDDYDQKSFILSANGDSAWPGGQAQQLRATLPTADKLDNPSDYGNTTASNPHKAAPFAAQPLSKPIKKSTP